MIVEPDFLTPSPPTNTADAAIAARSLRRTFKGGIDAVRGIDLTALNAGRADYNRYYLLEKECAVRSPSIARQGYSPLDAVTHDELLAAFPPLTVPALRSP
jgi:hypothetical protein